MDILDPGSNFQMNGDQGTSRPKRWPEWNSRPVSVKSPIWKDSYIFLRWLTQWNPFWTPGDSRTSWCGVISIGWIQGTSFPSIMDSTPIYGNGKLLEEEINTGCDCCQSQIPPEVWDTFVTEVNRLCDVTPQKTGCEGFNFVGSVDKDVYPWTTRWKWNSVSTTLTIT